MTCEVFSDMSQRHGAIGYCVMIRQLMRPIVVRHGDITDSADCSTAELIALAIGLSLCPRDVDSVIAYTDLDQLPGMMRGVRHAAIEAAQKRGLIPKRKPQSPQQPKQEKRIGLKLPKRKWPITWTTS